MSAIATLSFHADGNSIRARFVTSGLFSTRGLLKAALFQPRLLTPAASLRRETNRSLMAAAHSSLVRYFHQRLPTTYEPVGEIGRALRTRARLSVLPTTVTGVPIWTRSKNRAARSRGIRTHPWDAGYPGR